MINLLASASLATQLGSRLKTPAAHEADRERWADTTYNSVVNAPNQAAALDALHYLYDQAGLRNPGQFGSGAIGAATQQARDYIKTKYDAALAIIRAKYNDPSLTGGANAQNASTADKVDKAAAQTSLTQLVVIGGVVAVGAYFIMKKAG